MFSVVYWQSCCPCTAAGDFLKGPSVSWLLGDFRWIPSNPPPAILFQLMTCHLISLQISTTVLSPSSGMRSNQMSPLLQYPGVHSYRFYIFQVEEAAVPGARQSFSIDKLPVAVLCDGYKVPFHHLPPASLVSQMPSLHGRVRRLLRSRS